MNVTLDTKPPTCELLGGIWKFLEQQPEFESKHKIEVKVCHTSIYFYRFRGGDTTHITDNKPSILVYAGMEKEYSISICVQYEDIFMRNRLIIEFWGHDYTVGESRLLRKSDPSEPNFLEYLYDSIQGLISTGPSCIPE